MLFPGAKRTPGTRRPEISWLRQLEMTKQKLRWGILGTGMIAGKFAFDLPRSQGGVLLATGSRTLASAQRFSFRYGGKACAGYESVLHDPAVDAVYVALPNGMHHEWTLRALEAGKHVLCEKPFAANFRQAEEMFAAADRSGCLLVEAFMYRAHPLLHSLIATVRSGILGELRLIRSNFTFARPELNHDARYHSGQSGGALMDVGCYCVNLCRQVVGVEPDAVQAMAHLHPGGVDEYAAALLRFPGDVLATITCGMTVVSDDMTHIAGTEGRIAIRAFWFGRDGFTVTRGDHTQTIQVEETRPLYAMEADAFAAAVFGQAPPWISREDTLGNMLVLDTLRQSAGVPLG